MKNFKKNHKQATQQKTTKRRQLSSLGRAVRDFFAEMAPFVKNKGELNKLRRSIPPDTTITSRGYLFRLGIKTRLMNYARRVKPKRVFLNMDPIPGFKKEKGRSMTNYERSQYFRSAHGSKRLERYIRRLAA